MKLGEAHSLQVEAIPTGCLSLDIALGVGGIPRGRIVEIYGPESSGKTTVCLHVVAEAQRLNLPPGEHKANTTRLLQLLDKGHHGVQLEPEARERIVTWIDLNGPCYGTWHEIAEIPGGADRRRTRGHLPHCRGGEHGGRPP